MAFQTPAHVLVGLGHGYLHLGNIAVTGLTINPGGDVRAVIEMDKIGFNGYRNPGNGLALMDV